MRTLSFFTLAAIIHRKTFFRAPAPPDNDDGGDHLLKDEYHAAK
jgi:hypothetical protein